MERITRHLEALVRALQEHGPLRRADLTGVEGLRGARPVQLERLLEQAVAAGAVNVTGDRIEAVPVDAPAADEADGVRASGPLRIVAIDFESVVRTTAAYPYVERRAFQVGALRFGRDWDWVFENRSVNRFCELPEVGDGPAWQITSPTIASRHEAEAVPAEVWLAELDAVLDGADVVVAYNGLELDFPLLDEERERAGLPPLSGVELVDGLVLALSVWPNPPNNHRLANLAERLNVRVERYTWHDALSDCRLLATVVWAASRTVARHWDPALADLVLTACHESPTWAVVSDLGRRPPSGHRPGDDEVAAILGAELDTAGITPRRRPPSEDPPPPPAPVNVPGALVGAEGRVDPHLLAEVARGEPLARRTAQGQMAELVGGWVAVDGGGLVEAPTGTGKSLVLLGAALDWVRRSPGHRAVIATHTKQLQSQMARDVQRLVDSGVTVLAGTTDLVKGASNRLSVRGLTVALADACRTERRRGVYDDPARRELLAYLAVRFVTAQTLSERWLARSVDGVDIPVVFSRTSRGLVGAWLAGVSQHDQGEYRPDAEVPLPTRAIRTVAHQVTGWARLAGRLHPDGGLAGGAMVLTTSRSSAAAIAEASAAQLAAAGIPLATTETLGNARAVDSFQTRGGVLVGTRGLWQGVDIDDAERLRVVWINKLPFAAFADPVVAARRAHAAAAARAAGADDPDRAADEAYYLPLAALGLRQAVGRLIRSIDHRGVIFISDAKLSGNDARRRMYRRVFLGSLDAGLRRDAGGDVGAGNVVSTAQAWAETIRFAGDNGFLDPDAAAAAVEPAALNTFVDLPEMLAIRARLLDEATVAAAKAADLDGFAADVVERCQAVARVLGGNPATVLRPEQRDAIAAVARGEDLMALLPTGFGKSFCYQLPGLVLPGVTIVVSPLVSLMVDQAMGLGSTIGGMVRALTGPMRESNSRLGKTQVAETLRGEGDHGIRLIYLSPERLTDARFRDLIDEGVSKGIVARLAIDEAHTLVDWGDDFRPAFRRLDRWLSGLRTRYPLLQVSAFTATANRTVREGIRTRIFGAAAEGPAGGDTDLVTVAANPLRADLALWRRRMPGGANAVAGLLEAVVDALDQHAIFYCTTVKEVERVYASLRDYLSDAQADRVLRYHGRLSQAEKAAVAIAFRTAARAGEDDFRPMIVVATSAFGLGVDRDDIRCVFCVSPPTDLAALYQQLGRAGRDSSRRVPGVDDVPLNAGMALVTPKAWRTVTWMASQDLALPTLRGFADRLLTAGAVGEVVAVDADDVAAAQIADEVAAGRLGAGAVFSARLADKYRGGAVRALAALTVTGGLDDLGDIPDRVRVTAGEVACDDDAWAPVIDELVAWEDAAGAGVPVLEAHDHLATAVAGYGEVAADAAELWTGLAAAHDRGWVDVSQQVTRSRLAVFRVLTATRPGGYDADVTNRQGRVATELAELRRWFDGTGCVHEGFAAHFGVPALPPGACATANVRCSGHWNDAEVLAADPTPHPALQRAFFTPRPRPMAATADGRANFERRVRHHLTELLWSQYKGLTAPMLRRVLHGDDSYFSTRSGRRRRLWPSLLYHTLRGTMPGIRQRSVDAALAQLAAEGEVADAGNGVWRWSGHIAADHARAAREAARVAAAGTAT